MNQDNKCHKYNVGCSMIAFFAGAAIGAVVAALTTKKTGAERCDDIKDLSHQLKLKAKSLTNEANKAWKIAKQYTSSKHECNSECVDNCKSNIDSE